MVKGILVLQLLPWLLHNVRMDSMYMWVGQGLKAYVDSWERTCEGVKRCNKGYSTLEQLELYMGEHLTNWCIRAGELACNFEKGSNSCFERDRELLKDPRAILGRKLFRND